MTKKKSIVKPLLANMMALVLGVPLIGVLGYRVLYQALWVDLVEGGSLKEAVRILAEPSEEIERALFTEHRYVILPTSQGTFRIHTANWEEFFAERPLPRPGHCYNVRIQLPTRGRSSAVPTFFEEVPCEQ